MYNILKNHITHSKYDLPQVLERIKALYGRMEITDEQRNELETLAREKADFKSNLDTAEKLLEMEERIRALEEKLFAQEGASGEDGKKIEPYQPGKWYFNGDQILYNDAVYECIAPLGAVCTWNPDEHPAYWKEVQE